VHGGAVRVALAVGALLLAALAAGLTGRTRHQRVSLCAVCCLHQRQYFFSSTRSGVFRFDLFDW
jgi:hypothetical protein